MVDVNVSSGISGESNKGASGGMVGGSESKTLAENRGDEGVLSGEGRVSEDSKVLGGKPSADDVINGSGRKPVESGRLETNDKRDVSKSRAVGVRSLSNRWDSWESWGVMNMVGRVLGGKYSMDDEVEDVNTSKNRRGAANVVANTNAWQGVIGEPALVNKSDVESVVFDKESGGLVSDDLVEGTGLNGDNDKGSDELISDDLVKGTDLNWDEDSNDLISDDLVGVTTLNGGQDSNDRIVDDLVALNGGKDSDEMTVDDLVEGTGLTGDQDLNDLISDDLVEGTALNGGKDSDEMIVDDLVEGTGLNGGQDSVSNELVPNGKWETDEVNDVEVDAFLIPKTRGEHQITEKEGDYYVADLVWGKVKSHPWWPGQIFPPIAASDKAAKHFRKQSYLIAYFGDQTFAWNERSSLKPFRMYFSQMEKLSNSDGFCHAVSCALDEVARRVEFGLSCPCLPEEVYDKIKIQVVSNAGIWEDKNVRDGGDNLSSAASFLPSTLVQFVEAVAECPKSKTDRLQFTIAKAQLLAYNRWKGHYELPFFEVYHGFLEDDVQVTVKGEADDFSSKKRKSTAPDGSSQKRRNLSGDKEFPTIKEKRISALMSSSSSLLPNVDEKPVKRAGRRPISSGKNSEGINSIASKPKVKKRKSQLPTSPIGDVAPQPKTYLKAGDCEKSCEAEMISGEESELVEIIPAEFPTPDVILLKLNLAAKIPMQGFNLMVSEVDFLREFRNWICLEKSSFGNAEMDAGKHKGKQLANSETANASGFEGTEDSYWTDRIIQSYSQDQALFEPNNPNDKAVHVQKPDIGVAMNVDDLKESDTVVVDMDSEKQPSDQYQPTALILNFTNLDSIPPITNLNEIFSRYGPLKDSETEILRKSKRAKVIFMRRADAETAFSSTGKYSIFGPSLVSYRLHYSPTPRKSRGATKQKKKDASLKDDNA